MKNMHYLMKNMQYFIYFTHNTRQRHYLYIYITYFYAVFMI